MTGLREETAQELDRFLTQAGLDNPWTNRREASTRWHYAPDGELYEPARLRLHAQLIDEQRLKFPAPTREGAVTVVVTAGPPGAGKTTTLATMPELDGFRHIDADQFKDGLLRQAMSDGLLEQWANHLLGDGRPVAARELTGFVHAESTAVADMYRHQALRDGEDVVIHGTLSSIDHVAELLADFDLAGYTKLIVVDVEVPREQAVEQALARWWTVRDVQRDPLGGRFVPSSAIARYYPAGQAESISSDNATTLHGMAADIGWDVQMIAITNPEPAG